MSEAIERIREKATALLTRINNDAHFKAQVLNNPEVTLAAAGFPVEAVPEFVAALGIGEVNGYYIDCIATYYCCGGTTQLC
jgi:hypothetical protein